MAESARYVGVVGPSDASDGELAVAEAVGQRLGGAGWIVVCGGLGGVMAAACRGAQAAGGMTVGLLPGMSRAAGNPHLTVSLPTGLGEMRNGLLVRASDALVAVGGSWGTLSEIALALRTGRPVIGLGTWGVDTGDRAAPAVIPVSDVDDVVVAVRSALALPEPDGG
ncbi:TIGR00725 family protein [Frankia canadensis]|nr:TIGR00725 family protein [Frankia canadensis]